MSSKNSTKVSEWIEIWSRIKDRIWEYFDFDVIYENKYKSSKIKSFNDEIRTVFYDDGLPAEETTFKAYLIILIDSVYRSNESGYPQVISEEGEYIVKNETTKRFIAEKLFDSDFNSNCDYVS